MFPDGTRHVAPLPPGVARGKVRYGPGVRALAVMLYHQYQSTKGRITALSTTSAWTSRRARITNRLSAGLSFSGRQTNEKRTHSPVSPTGQKVTPG